MSLDENGDITASTAIFNLEHPDPNIQAALINTKGTETTDGATFYLIGHFDEVYRELHGTLKSGALKNVYVSGPGENPDRHGQPGLQLHPIPVA